MGFSLSGMFSKNKSKTTTNQTQTNTPTNPDFVQPQIESLTGNIVSLGQQDPSKFVAPMNSLITQAGQGASTTFFDPSAYQSANGLFQGLMDTKAPTVKASSLLDGGLDKYMSPYLQDVVNTSLARYDDGADEQMAAARLAQAADTTFGGSGGFAQIGKLGGELALGRGQLSSGLYDQGFGRATDLANHDAERQQRAAESNAQLAMQMLGLKAQSGRDIVDTASRYYGDQAGIQNQQAGIGQLQQQIQQGLAGAPIDVAAKLASAYSGLTGPLNLLHGETQNLQGVTKGKSSGFSIGGSVNNA